MRTLPPSSCRASEPEAPPDASPLGAVGTAGVVAAVLDLVGLNAYQTAAAGLLASSDVR